MRGIIVFALLFFTVNAWAINHQDELELVSEWVEGFDKDYPIIVVDRDKTNFLIESNNAREDQDKRYELIKSYIKEVSNIDLSLQDFVNIDPYLTSLSNSAVALPILTGGYEGDYKFCAVFANAPNGNAQVESNRIIGFNQEEAFLDYPDFNYNNLNNKMTFEELYLFSLYHEASHCLDDKFIIEMQENGGEPHGIHEAEIYAEIMAYFALIPRLGKEVASRRAQYRTIYSRIVGEFLTTQPTFGNPHVTSGGAIYNLGPYLYKAQELIHFQQIDLNQPLLYTAKDFVLNEALTSREFHAVVTFLIQGSERANEQYSAWAYNDPHFFYTAYMELVQYENHTENTLRMAFSPQETPVYDELPSLDEQLLCQAMESKDLDLYLQTLNEYRNQINDGFFRINEINEVYETLNYMSLNCRVN
jgi:hypothetical protein